MKKILAVTHPTEKRILASLAVAFFVLVVAYMYLVAATVFHVTARKNIQYQSQIRAAHVADLESEFLKESTSIARAARGESDLSPVKKKHFVRIAPGRTLTLYDES
tara:strand:+ start:106753 stop:107070 length:318 start_codon:yes stop_codon:yes gene_type:complete